MHNRFASAVSQLATIFGAIGNATRSQARYSELQRTARSDIGGHDGSDIVRRTFDRF